MPKEKKFTRENVSHLRIKTIDLTFAFQYEEILQREPDAVWTEERLDCAGWNLLKQIAVAAGVPAIGVVSLLLPLFCFARFLEICYHGEIDLGRHVFGWQTDRNPGETVEG
jgi:hypothetical protein